MCFATPSVKPPAPVTPPPPPAPTATQVEEPGARKRKRGTSELSQLRQPLNPTGLPYQPRIGL
jgi:hypothetical protein